MRVSVGRFGAGFRALIMVFLKNPESAPQGGMSRISSINHLGDVTYANGALERGGHCTIWKTVQETKGVEDCLVYRNIYGK
jgi:hypothetical protein